MTASVRLPPLEYALFVELDDEGEPRADVRAALEAMAESWNAGHDASFTWNDEDGFEMLSLVLPGGAQDPERPALERHLVALERAMGVKPARGVAGPPRTSAEHQDADFIQFLAGDAPAGFVTNRYASAGPRPRCSVCGRDGGDADRPSTRPLELDIASLERRAHARGIAPPHIIAIDHRWLVSAAVQAHLAESGAQGYTTVPVLDRATGQASTAYALLRATTTWSGWCDAHTPTDPPGCSGCGHDAQRLGFPHVQAAAVAGLDVVATHDNGFAGLHVSRRLFHGLTAAGFGPLQAYGSFDLCDCPASRWPASTDDAPSPQPIRTAPLDALLSFIRAPSPLAYVRRCGTTDPSTSRPMMHRLGTKASPLALAALERSHPEVAQLRPLALQVDGFELFSPLLEDRALPSLDSARMDPVAGLRIERASDWPRLREEMQAWATHLEDPLIPHDGLPFATIPASSDLLVMFEGRVYYVSPLGGGPHNEVVADSLEAFFGIVVYDLARFLMETASVVRYYDDSGDQYYPVAFRPSSDDAPSC